MTSRLEYGLRHIAWLPHSRGFGVQSPTDYRFVVDVLTEPLPYYAYQTFGGEADWMQRKLCRLYFRLANHCQPETVIDNVGVAKYVLAACAKAKIAEGQQMADIAFVPAATNYHLLFPRLKEKAIAVFHGTDRHRPLWRCIENDPRARITFDLYYCGIVVNDSGRGPLHYKINF